MKMNSDIKRWMRKYQNFILGALVGVLMTWYVYNHDQALLFSIQQMPRTGLMDRMFSMKDIMQAAVTKVGIVLITVGMLVGGYVVPWVMKKVR